MKTKPLNNYCLIEVIRENDAVSRMDDNEDMSYGKCVDYSAAGLHITASAAIEFSPDMYVAIANSIAALKGKIVRWEQYAEGGQTFEEDGKTYALIPWWRLISVTEVV